MCRFFIYTQYATKRIYQSVTIKEFAYKWCILSNRKFHKIEFSSILGYWIVFYFVLIDVYWIYRCSILQWCLQYMLFYYNACASLNPISEKMLKIYTCRYPVNYIEIICCLKITWWVLLKYCLWELCKSHGATVTSILITLHLSFTGGRTLRNFF